IIDGHAVPVGGIRGLVMVQGRGVAIQGNGLVQQLIVRCALNTDDQVVPGAAHRVARNSGRNPLVMDVVIDIPLVPTGDTALMSPNEGVTTGELIDIEFKPLGDTWVADPEVNLIGEIVERGNQRVAVVGQTLR